MSDATATKSKISVLELVYPLMSNREAVWFKDDPEVEALLRESDFNAMGGRPEVKFSHFQKDAFDDGHRSLCRRHRRLKLDYLRSRG